MNEYDSARLADALQQNCAMERVADPEAADLILLNTCSIREKAQEKVFSDLGRWKGLKDINPNLIIGVGGCVATQEKENIIKRAPYVDIIFGPNTVHRVPDLYNKVLEKRSHVVEVNCQEFAKFSELPAPKVNGPSAYLSIMEGCNKYCSYCIVPFTRGKEFSRPVAEVMHEVEGLVLQGVKEIHLLGQNVNDYNGLISKTKMADLADLINEIANISEVLRIRFTTSYPTSLNDKLINAFVNVEKLVNHLHLPVQSGSNLILKKMRRRYTVDEYIERVSALRKIRPEISISSDFIVGFPGETTEDFQRTLDLVSEVNFDASYSFIYSPRPGTVAAELPDDISLVEKKQRLSKLQTLLTQQANSYSEAMVGTIQDVLILGFSRKDTRQLTGRTENNRIVNFTADKSLIGQMTKVEITTVLRNCLLGELI